MLFFAHYVPELTLLAEIIYDQSYHKINIPYFNLSMEIKQTVFPNSSFSEIEIKIPQTIANKVDEYYIQSTSLDTNMIILISFFKAMIN